MFQGGGMGIGPLDLRELIFGVPAAERDDDLISCFVPSSVYDNIKSGKKTIILANCVKLNVTQGVVEKGSLTHK